MQYATIPIARTPARENAEVAVNIEVVSAIVVAQGLGLAFY